MAVKRSVKRCTHLYRSGDAFRSIHLIVSGLMKRVTQSIGGHEQIIGFAFSGDLFGFDGIDSGVHCCDAVALQDSIIWSIRYDRLSDITRDLPSLGCDLHRAMSRQIVLDNRMMILLGRMFARERIAAFLLMFVRHSQASRANTCDLELRITREEMGSYLGLRLETVSREMRKLIASGILVVTRFRVVIMDVALLETIAGQTSAQHCRPDFAGPDAFESFGAALLKLIAMSDLASPPVTPCTIESHEFVWKG